MDFLLPFTWFLLRTIISTVWLFNAVEYHNLVVGAFALCLSFYSGWRMKHNVMSIEINKLLKDNGVDIEELKESKNEEKK